MMPPARKKKPSIVSGERLLPSQRLSRIHRTSQVSIGEVFYTGKGQIGPRIQDRYELVVLHKGKMQITVDEIEVELRDLEAILLKPGHREVFIYDEKINEHHQSWCILRKQLMPVNLLSRLSELSMGYCVSVSSELLTLLDLALAVQTHSKKLDAQFYEQLALTIFYEYFRLATQAEGGTDVYPPGLIRALDVIEHNLIDQISLHDIARKAGVSSNHLIKLFRTHLDTTPIHRLWNLRVQRGAELLRSTVLNISEVSDQAGFRSPFHFSRSFRKTYGFSPSEFREKSWQSAQLSISDKLPQNDEIFESKPPAQRRKKKAK